MYTRTGSCLFALALAASALVAGCNKPPETSNGMPATSTEVANVSDVDITQHVTTALQQNASLKGFAINVIALKGDVRLIGVVDTQAQIDEALRIARASEGVHAIHDELTVKK